MMGEFKKAGEAFERATQLDPKNSVYYHWLGKAHGRRAETSSPFTAPVWASKARQAFEKSVELDEDNIEAINDLFSYYLEAPGFLGGGLDKAAAIAQKINAIDPIEYHYAMAQIADKRQGLQRRGSSLPQSFRAGAQAGGPHHRPRQVSVDTRKRAGKRRSVRAGREDRSQRPARDV